MKRTGVIFALVLALGMGVGWFGHQHLSAQQAPATRTVLLRTDLAGVEGKEAVLVVAEIAPGGTTGKHLHAGQEFAYLLEGSLRLVLDGFRIKFCGHHPPMINTSLTRVHRMDLLSTPHEFR